jgi:hypothetical protein
MISLPSALYPISETDCQDNPFITCEEQHGFSERFIYSFRFHGANQLTRGATHVNIRISAVFKKNILRVNNYKYDGAKFG